MHRLIAPSLLSANFAHLGRDIEMVNNSMADWFHIDVMDGVFVPNISFGFPIIKFIKQNANKPLDVHLMIVEPERYFERFKNIGADVLSIHYEASTHLHRSLNAIRALGMKAGVVLNPHTPVTLLEDVLPEADMVLLMSVNPGYGGQSFIEHTYSKISSLREMVLRKNLNTMIEVDGGVSLENASELFEAGADVLVAGNSVFSSDDPVDMIKLLKQ